MVTDGPTGPEWERREVWEPVRSQLLGTRFADVRFIPETGSTNADVVAWARAGAPEGLVLVADHQTAGRGRHARRWEAPPGSSLLASILTRPHTIGLPDPRVHLVTTAIGVAAAEAARAATGADIRLKWPNDLTVDTDDGIRKLSGVLAETTVHGGRITAVVAGIGVNVNWPSPVPGELAATAIALNHLAGCDLDRTALLVELLRGLDRWYSPLGTPAGASELVARYRQLSSTIGRRVRVETPAGAVVGDAIDIDDEGRLLVVDECPDRPRVVTAGDVITLRPAR